MKWLRKVMARLAKPKAQRCASCGARVVVKVQRYGPMLHEGVEHRMVDVFLECPRCLSTEDPARSPIIPRLRLKGQK
jgi:uncharacterized protein with PIN domain